MMKIGELAHRAGVSVRALRYYEEQKLLYSERTNGGQRVYLDAAVERVVLIQQLFSAGLPSRTIVDLLPCMETGTVTEAQLSSLIVEQRRIDEQIASLSEASSRLRGVISSAAGVADDCVAIRVAALVES